MSTSTQPTLMDHVHELRSRLLYSLGIFIVGGILGYIFRAKVIRFLQRPLHETLYYTTPTGSFEFIMQVCAVIGLIVALPVVIYNLLRFIEPALPKRLTKKLLCVVVCLSFTLALGGAAFAYYVSMPAALHFFTSVTSGAVKPLISVNDYFHFVFMYLVTFALVFQLPMLLLLLDHITPIGPSKLRKARKFVIAGAFAVAIITPSAPDPLSQVILALPIILLYEASLIGIWIRSRMRRQAPPLDAALSVKSPQPAIVRPAVPTTQSSVQPLLRRRPVQSRSIDLRNMNVSYTPEPAPVAHILDLRNLA